MDNVRTQLEALGISTKALSDDQVKAIAKAMKVAMPREVQIVPYNGADYVKTEGFAVPHKSGDASKTQQARGLFVRVEALDQAIEDLQAAKASLAKK